MTVEHKDLEASKTGDTVDRMPTALLVNFSLYPDPIEGESPGEYAYRCTMLALIMTELGYTDF